MSLFPYTDVPFMSADKLPELTYEQIDAIAHELWQYGLIEKPMKSEVRAIAKAVIAADRALRGEKA